MNLDEFAELGGSMVDYIADYIDSIAKRRVSPNISPGYLHMALPSTPPMKGVSLDKILEEVEKYILPGLTQSQHPGFHAFLPASSSFVGTLGAMLADTLGHTGFDWNVSPSGCKLEVITVNWYGKLLGLPECFMQTGYNSRGAGILMRSTSETIFIAMVTARRHILRKLLNRNPSLSTSVLVSSLVVYCSEETQYLIQKLSVATLVNVKVLGIDDNHKLRSQIVEKAMIEDEKAGLIPFFINISLGSSWCGSCDPINEIGAICRRHGVWLHVDASYGGNAMICPEYRHHLKGIGYASSLNVNPDCWMPMHVDFTVLFVKDRYILKDAVILDRTECGYGFLEKDWGFPCKTEYRSLGFWMVMRSYGIEGMQKIIRNHTQLAALFEDFIRSDDRFTFESRNFGIVCFYLKGSDEINKRLKQKIIATGKVFVNMCHLRQRYLIRFAVCREKASVDDIKHAWKIICEEADKLLNGEYEEPGNSLSDIFDEYYGYSFL